MGYPLSIRTYGGCPFAASRVLLASTGKGGSPQCGDAITVHDDWLLTQKPGIVFVANTDFYTRDVNYLVSNLRAEVFTDRQDKTCVFAEDVAESADRFAKAGHDVVIFQPIPNFRLDTEEASRERWEGVTNCPMVRPLTNSWAVLSPETLAEIELRQGELWSRIEDLDSRRGVSVLDFREALCPSGVCSVERPGLVVYREYLHLTIEGARSLSAHVLRHVTSLEDSQKE